MYKFFCSAYKSQCATHMIRQVCQGTKDSYDTWTLVIGREQVCAFDFNVNTVSIIDSFCE